ncbi:hypothetical protein EDB87DRAFT_1712583 [Lactarius vividus]|nr:hypothetical protein EDB87DRAFT_1712583 [Lactarius vividus]
MDSNSQSASDMVDQTQVIHLKEISVDFIKTRPTSDLELVFKDDAGVTRKSNKFRNGALVHWDLDIYLKIHTSATLTIQRALFKIRVAQVFVEFKPYKFGDDKVVRLEGGDVLFLQAWRYRDFVYRKSKSPADVTRVLGSQAAFTNIVAPMNTQQPRRRIPEVLFRVLIIGRANAGKTSILQRICETTESPVIYHRNEEVKLDPSMMIDDELIFSNHRGYVFHDSRGIESGSTDELGILQNFHSTQVWRTATPRQITRDMVGFPSVYDYVTTADGRILRYCVPMDNQRPGLDLKYFKDICPEKNVPVIVVFTKYDQFWQNVRIHVEDFGSPDDNILDVADKQFQEHYLLPLGDDVRFVRLEKMHKQNMGCDRLIETTAAALNDDAVRLMLLAVQRGNLELSVKSALKR